MKKIINLLIFSIIGFTSLSAQNARNILDKASDSFLKSGGATVKFTLNTKEVKSTQIYSQDGTAYMKGDKFKIEIPGAITWFDGKTQWVYIEDNEEVNISNPTGSELQAISPSVLFSLYKTGYDLKSNGEKSLKGKTVIEIEMKAQSKKNQLQKVIVSVNKADNTFAQITLYDSNGMENTLIVNKYTATNSFTDNFFVFNKEEYPDAEIVDLR